MKWRGHRVSFINSKTEEDNWENSHGPSWQRTITTDIILHLPFGHVMVGKFQHRVHHYGPKRSNWGVIMSADQVRGGSNIYGKYEWVDHRTTREAVVSAMLDKAYPTLESPDVE